MLEPETKLENLSHIRCMVDHEEISKIRQVDDACIQYMENYCCGHRACRLILFEHLACKLPTYVYVPNIYTRGT